jgi:vesicle coat complex subunit
MPLFRYASEVDVDFVRKSVKAIGQTAVKIDSAAERCVNVLLELIATRVSYVVQEAVVVMKVCLPLVAQETESDGCDALRTSSGNTPPHTRA